MQKFNILTELNFITSSGSKTCHDTVKYFLLAKLPVGHASVLSLINLICHKEEKKKKVQR